MIGTGKFFVYLLLIINCFLFNVNAQYKWQYGFSWGMMKYDGDIGSDARSVSANAFNSGSSSYSSFSLHLGYRFNEFFNLELSSTYGQIGAADNKITGNSPSAINRRIRNIDFISIIAELSLLGEIYPTIIFETAPKQVTGKLRPYITAGIGFFFFLNIGLRSRDIHQAMHNHCSLSSFNAFMDQKLPEILIDNINVSNYKLFTLAF